VAGDEELKARALLAEMQLRIAEGPHAALGIDHNAASEQIRAAFLQLTKRFHPARFGRMSTELQKLSNEIFLGIKGAHDQLQKAAGGASRASSSGQSGSIPIADLAKQIAPDTIRRTAGIPPINRSHGTTPPDQAHHLARGTQRPSTPNVTGTGQVPRPGTPQPKPATPPPSTRPSSPAVARTLTPSEITRPGVQPPTNPALARGPIRTVTPPAGIPQQQRPITPIAATRPTPPRPSTPPGAAPPKPIDYNPGTIRYSGASPVPTPARHATSTPPFDERQALRESLMMLNERKWADARQALHTLAAKVPQSKNYRALLCYARGREAHAAGKSDEAQLEYQRALQLDPELDLAKQAIAELTRRR
jgi:hypothetical protein